MAIQVNGQMILTVLETLATGVPDVASGNAVVTHNTFNVGFALNANTGPAVSKVASFSQALTAGSATVDLTSLTGTNGAAVDGTGLRLIGILATNAGTHAMTIKPGTSNGYNILGIDGSSVKGQATLQPGESLMKYDPSGLSTAISATNKNIALAGTLVETMNIILVLG